MNVLFTHSYFLRFDEKEFRSMSPYPPLGTLYAAAVARDHGYSVALFDSMLATAETDLIPALTKHHPQVLVIYDDDFNYLTKMCLTRMRQAAFVMTQLARERGCLVVIHGSDAPDHLEEYFRHGASAVLCGEAEQTLLEYLDAAIGGRGSIDHVPGLAYMDGNQITRTVPREPSRDLDKLPFPARDLIDMHQYRTLWRRHHGMFSTNIVTTRGCPFHCNWCAKPLYGQVYNSRSPQNVVREMAELKATLRPDHLWFCDDIFGLKPHWIEEFSHEVTAADAVIPFKCLARVDLLLKSDTIPSLRRAGCESVWVGAESGSQKILDAMEKGTTVAQIYEASRRLHEAGIRIGFFLQYGYPGESASDIDLTLRMVQECMPDDIGISVSYPLPGTPFFDRVKRELGEKQNWVDSNDLAMMFRGTFVPDFYRVLHAVTHKRFRVWQAERLLKESLARPWRMRRGDARKLLAAGYHRATLPSLEARMRTLAKET